jgi:hypothetical protein
LVADAAPAQRELKLHAFDVVGCGTCGHPALALSAIHATFYHYTMIAYTEIAGLGDRGRSAR